MFDAHGSLYAKARAHTLSPCALILS